jgi:hypothetical protein
MYNLNRIYKDSSGNEIRIDTIIMTKKRDSLVVNPEVGIPYERNVSTITLNTSADRTVASIEAIGNYTSIDTTNFDWAKWNTTTPEVYCNMSDLPDVTDTV